MDEYEVSLTLDCPTCGAAPQEKCQMRDGAPSPGIPRFSLGFYERPRAERESAHSCVAGPVTE